MAFCRLFWSFSCLCLYLLIVFNSDDPISEFFVSFIHFTDASWKSFPFNFHRTIEWFELGGPLKAISSNSPAMNRDTYSSISAQSPSSLTLGVSEGKGPTSSLCNLFQCHTTLIVKNVFFMFNLTLFSLSLKPLPLVPSLWALIKKTSIQFP